MRGKKQKNSLPDFITNTLKHLRPPESLLVSEWAEKYRILDSKSSAMPGKWNNHITPYLIDIMNELNNIETQEIVFVKPTQVGGTEALQNMVGYITMQDPSPTMIVYPTDKLAESVSENRIQPMMRISPELKKRFKDNESSMLELQFEGMYISLNGANSPSSLSSKPCRFLFLDEVDKYPGSTKKEADPIRLARERTKTFPNKKIFMTSTPTLKTNHIWKNMEDADVIKHFKIPCPHCDEYIELDFKQIKWPSDKNMGYADRAEFANYICQECGGIINDQAKARALRYGKWEVVQRKTQYQRKVAYWMNTLYSPFVRFSEIAKEFLTTKDDPEAFQNFVNSWLAEPWEDTKLKTTAELVLERQTDCERFIVPEWAEMLTAGVDVQENCLYWTIRAWGTFLTSQNIAHGQALGFSDIEKIMNLEYVKENGEVMMVNLCAVDSGDQTDAVYDFCAVNNEWAIPVKGVASGYAHFKISTINRVSSKAHGTRLVLVDGGKYKDMIASRMKKENGKGSWMVYKGCDREYAEQVTSEHKVNTKTSGGRVTQMWVPKTSHVDNHYLDTEVYAFAAADVLGVRNLYLLEEKQEEKTDVNEQAETFNSGWLGTNKNWI